MGRPMSLIFGKTLSVFGGGEEWAKTAILQWRQLALYGFKLNLTDLPWAAKVRRANDVLGAVEIYEASMDKELFIG